MIRMEHQQKVILSSEGEKKRREEAVSGKYSTDGVKPLRNAYCQKKKKKRKIGNIL